MKKELELWQFAAAHLRDGRSVMLLVVAESSGSSPGRQGFKMAIAENEMCGSIGGGVMEVRLVELAKEQSKKTKGKSKSEIRNPKAEIVEQVHQKNSPESSGMICSGRQTVIFFKLNPAHLQVVCEIIEVLENDYYEFLQITVNEFQVIDLFKQLAPNSKTWNKFSSFDFRFEQTNENEFVYDELLGFKNKLFIIGGGHCALALSELMSKMDFHISLFDDRPNLNTLDKNKFVDAKIVVESYENIGDFIFSGTNVYVVVMTLGYKSDEIVVRKLLEKDFKYFGVLGSRAKMKTLLGNLAKENFPKEKLNQLRTPIGLPIHSQTPEEIAVSIAAEIIQVKNKTL